jgi:hypothetical protein
MTQKIIAPKGAVEVEPSTCGNPSSLNESSSTGIAVTSESESSEHEFKKGMNIKLMIIVINADQNFV